MSLGLLRRWVRRAAPFVALLLAVSFARAADDNKIIFPGGSPSSATTAAAASDSGSMSSVSLYLGLVLAGVGAWFVWRGRRSAPLGRDSNRLTVGETRSLGNRQYLVVATYEDKKFLLGVCPGRIDLLAPLHESAPLEKPRS